MNVVEPVDGAGGHNTKNEKSMFEYYSSLVAALSFLCALVCIFVLRFHSLIYCVCGSLVHLLGLYLYKNPIRIEISHFHHLGHFFICAIFVIGYIISFGLIILAIRADVFITTYSAIVGIIFVLSGVLTLGVAFLSFENYVPVRETDDISYRTKDMVPGPITKHNITFIICYIITVILLCTVSLDHLQVTSAIYSEIPGVPIAINNNGRDLQISAFCGGPYNSSEGFIFFTGQGAPAVTYYQLVQELAKKNISSCAIDRPGLGQAGYSWGFEATPDNLGRLMFEVLSGMRRGTQAYLNSYILPSARIVLGAHSISGIHSVIMIKYAHEAGLSLNGIVWFDAAAPYFLNQAWYEREHQYTGPLQTIEQYPMLESLRGFFGPLLIPFGLLTPNVYSWSSIGLVDSFYVATAYAHSKHSMAWRRELMTYTPEVYAAVDDWLEPVCGSFSGLKFLIMTATELDPQPSEERAQDWATEHARCLANEGDVKYITVNSGHYVFFDKPRLVAQQIVDYFFPFHY
ncbi:hypothetical protein PCE1_000437 [Barthelona sp. PCE]